MFASDSYKPKRTDGLPQTPKALKSLQPAQESIHTRKFKNIQKHMMLFYHSEKISTSYALDLGLFMLLSLFGDISDEK